MGDLRHRYRIVHGHARDTIIRHTSKRVTHCYRDGWWWVCVSPSDIGRPYDPEGAFETKESAIRHLRATLAQREGRVRNVRWKDGRTTVRPRLRRIPCNRVTPAQERAEMRGFSNPS